MKYLDFCNSGSSGLGPRPLAPVKASQKKQMTDALGRKFPSHQDPPPPPDKFLDLLLIY